MQMTLKHFSDCLFVFGGTLNHVHGQHNRHSLLMLCFRYHRTFLGLWLTLTLVNGQLVLYHQRVDRDREEAEGAEEPSDNSETKRPAENIGVPVGHPRAVKADHHSEDCNRRTDAYSCNTSQTGVQNTAIVCDTGISKTAGDTI